MCYLLLSFSPLLFYSYVRLAIQQKAPSNRVNTRWASCVIWRELSTAWVWNPCDDTGYFNSLISIWAEAAWIINFTEHTAKVPLLCRINSHICIFPPADFKVRGSLQCTASHASVRRAPTPQSYLSIKKSMHLFFSISIFSSQTRFYFNLLCTWKINNLCLFKKNR